MSCRCFKRSRVRHVRQAPILSVPEDFKVSSSLNGANGETTGSDDVPKRQAHPDIAKQVARLAQQIESLARDKRQAANRQAQRAPRGGRTGGGGGVAPSRMRAERSFQRSQSAPNQMAAAFVTPFAVPPGSVKNPSAPSVHTMAASVTSVAIIKPNAGGEAAAHILNCTARDRDTMVYTTGAHVLASGANQPRTAVALAGWTSSVNNAPIPITELNSMSLNGDREVETRSNVVGLRLTYIGRADAAAGTAYFYSKNTLDDVSNATWATLIGAPQVKTWTIAAGKTNEFTIAAGDPAHHQMMGGSGYPLQQPAAGFESTPYWDYTSGGASAPSSIATFRFTGMDPSASYRLEMISHNEYTGPNFDSTASATDIDGDDLNHAMKVHAAVARGKEADGDSHAINIVAAHRDEKIAAVGLQAAAAAGVPGASMGLMADKFLMSKQGTADTKLAYKAFSFLGRNRK